MTELLISWKLLSDLIGISLWYDKCAPPLPDLVLLPLPDLNEDSDPDTDDQSIGKTPQGDKRIDLVLSQACKSS